MEKQFLESVTRLLLRDLRKLEEEIRLFPDDASVWSIRGDIKNPAGNLCLHLCGNLQHYIGRVLGGTAYIRNRDNEFAAKNVSRSQLHDEIQRAAQAVAETLESLDPGVLLKEYPEKVFDYPMTTMHFLIHLEAHLGYHLGQVNYHRRMIRS
jgi:uncharacterized damage-inducible protein DinB